jgi:hypothetical protein
MTQEGKAISADDAHESHTIIGEPGIAACFTSE